MKCVTHCNDAVILAAHEWHSKSQTLQTVLILQAMIQTPHVQSAQIRGSITSNCHREKPMLLKTIWHQWQVGLELAAALEGLLYLYFAPRCVALCMDQNLGVHSQIYHLLYPAVFNPGAKGPLTWKGEKSSLTEMTLQIGGRQLRASFINNTYWMLAKPRAYLK